MRIIISGIQLVEKCEYGISEKGRKELQACGMQLVW